MTRLALLFVGKPLTIAAVGAALAVLSLVLRGRGRQPRMLLVAACGWLLYAAWEYLVLVRSPEANIRVDLLLIWPLLGILTAWGLFRLVR